jgi:hypothetical protein
MIIHKKVIQSLGKKEKRKRKLVGNYKFKVSYEFKSRGEMIDQKKYLLSLGWEVRYECGKRFILRGYYDVDSSYNKVEYDDKRYRGIVQPEKIKFKEREKVRSY